MLFVKVFQGFIELMSKFVPLDNSYLIRYISN